MNIYEINQYPDMFIEQWLDGNISDETFTYHFEDYVESNGDDRNILEYLTEYLPHVLYGKKQPDTDDEDIQHARSGTIECACGFRTKSSEEFADHLQYKQLRRLMT